MRKRRKGKQGEKTNEERWGGKGDKKGEKVGRLRELEKEGEKIWRQEWERVSELKKEGREKKAVSRIRQRRHKGGEGGRERLGRK